jgi:predicted enzyme related to lactoylglutathione lyase
VNGQVVHFEIPVDDRERASAFYRSAFGWEVTELPETGYSMLDTSAAAARATAGSDADGAPSAVGAVNGGMLQRDPHRTSPVVTIDVDDIDEALRTVEELGGATVLPKQAIPGMGFTAYFSDSEGNVLGLWQNG